VRPRRGAAKLSALTQRAEISAQFADATHYVRLSVRLLSVVGAGFVSLAGVAIWVYLSISSILGKGLP
jgi:hypothetical protein